MYAGYRDQFCGPIDRVLIGKGYDPRTGEAKDGGPKYGDLADCMRANAARFAAYKANYVERAIADILQDESMTEAERQEMADAAMQKFQRWGDAEANYAVQAAQMAQKWQDFEADGDDYLLQYRTANDDKVRHEHQLLDRITLPVNDDFWKEFYPPLGWNCRCTVVQVLRDKHEQWDSAEAIRLANAEIGESSFRFNPGITKQCFPDEVSYVKGATKRKEKVAHELCEDPYIVEAKQALLSATMQCEVLGETYEAIFIPNGVAHSIRDMYGEKCFWIKNEVIKNLPHYMAGAEYIGRKVSDPDHNSKKQTQELKRNSDYFYYYRIKLPTGERVILHFGHYREEFANPMRAGKMYLWSVSKNVPENVEAP